MKAALVCGYPRSGNTLLWKTLWLIQKANGDWKGWRDSMGISQWVLEDHPDKMFHKHAHLVDEVVWSPTYAKWQAIMLGTEFTPIASVESSLLWTHDVPGTFPANPDRQYYYVLRNPRHVLTSMAAHAARAEYRAMRPECVLSDSEKIVNNEEIMLHWAREWTEHVKGYCENRNAFELIKYEDLIQDRWRARFVREAITADGMTVYSIVEETTFNFMSQESPSHVGSKKPQLPELLIPKINDIVSEVLDGGILA